VIGRASQKNTTSPVWFSIFFVSDTKLMDHGSFTVPQVVATVRLYAHWPESAWRKDCPDTRRSLLDSTLTLTPRTISVLSSFPLHERTFVSASILFLCCPSTFVNRRCGTEVRYLGGCLGMQAGSHYPFATRNVDLTFSSTYSYIICNEKTSMSMHLQRAPTSCSV
jgi:hypothetical protein